MSGSRVIKFASLPLYRVLGLNHLYWAWQYAFHRHRPGSPVYYREREKRIRAICASVKGPEQDIGDLVGRPEYAKFDERLVEYPFVRARTRSGRRVLDVGCTMNSPFHLEWLKREFAEVHFFNLTYDPLMGSGNISMIVGDIRETFLPSDFYDQIICVSTLEHVGMNNDRYVAGRADGELAPAGDEEGWIRAGREMVRLCRPGGVVLVTVPYGVAGDFGWFHVFDEEKLRRLQAVAAERASTRTWYFRATPSGWAGMQRGEAVDTAYGGVFRSGASAVACVEMVKKS